MKDLIKSMSNGQWYIEPLSKVGEGYKKLMGNGLALIHPAYVDGRHISDDGVPYHTTIKAFDGNKDSPDTAHQIAANLNMPPPDPSNVYITPKIYKDRFGDDVHVLVMHGDDAARIADQYSKFTGMGWPPHPDGYKPHITVDEATYNRALQNGAKTAADMNISFGNAELRRGFDTLQKYPIRD